MSLRAAVGVLRLINGFVCAVGLAALAAFAGSFLVASREGAEWTTKVLSFGSKVSIACIAAAAAFFSLMPSRAMLRGNKSSNVGDFETIVLAALAAIAAAQFPSVLRWVTVDRSLLSQLGIAGVDPLGLNLIPMTLLYSLPFLAALLLAAFVATSAGAALAPRRVSWRLLAAGVALQAGLVACEYASAGALRDVGSAMVAQMNDEPGVSAQTIDWFDRHDAAARSVIARLAGVFGGYAVALIVAAVPGRSSEPETELPRVPAVSVPAIAHTPSLEKISSASADFDQSSYVLSARTSMLGLLGGRRFMHYDIDTVPRRSASRMSFSWQTGAVRKEPTGPDLLFVRPGERHGLLARAYNVVAPGGRVIGTFVPRDADWEIQDGSGRTIGHAANYHVSYARATHVIAVGEREVCRLTWVAGATPAVGEVDIEFLPAGDRRFDRALAVALAPILEDDARRARRRS